MKLSRLFLSLSIAGALPLSGCFSSQPGADFDTESSGAATSSTGQNDDGTSAPTSAGTSADSSGGGGCPGDPGTLGANCAAETPYCFEDSCVGCGSLPVGTCAEVDAGTPACNPDSGQCVECTSTDESACTGDTPVCVDEACAPCTADDQCDSGICVVTTGLCQPTTVSLQGGVLSADAVTPGPVADVELSIANIDPPLAAGPTRADGEYQIDEIPPGSLVDVALDVEEGWAGDMNSAFRTVHQVNIGLESPQVQDLRVVRYQWLGQVALDCGVYPFDAAATEWDVICSPGADGVAEPGCEGPQEGVGPFILTRSTVVGTFYEEDGTTPFTDPLSRGALSVVMNNGGIDTANVESAQSGDTDEFPFHVCWLDEDGDALVGSNSTTNITGNFVLFRVRNSQGLGQGTVTLEATGFDPALVRLSSSGSVGVVSMNRNNTVIERDFGLDVYPMFAEWGCLVCHSTGGVGAVNGQRDGFFADWSLDAQGVYDNIIGPGTVCDTTVPLNDPNWGTDPGVSSGRLRVCTNVPEESLLIMRPSAGVPRFNEVHPVDIFPGPEHPQMEVVRQWVEQGANPPANEPVDFATQVYPIFTERGCITCHTACESGMPGPGCVLDSESMSVWSDWNLGPNEVYQNLTAPGTNCDDPDNDPLRVCVNAPSSSLFVVRPLAGVPVNDPHPVEIFATEDDPDLQLIINWISQGATF